MGRMSQSFKWKEEEGKEKVLCALSQKTKNNVSRTFRGFKKCINTEGVNMSGLWYNLPDNMQLWSILHPFSLKPVILIATIGTDLF